MSVNLLGKADHIHLVLAALVARQPNQEVIVTKEEMDSLTGALYVESFMSYPVQPMVRLHIVPRETYLQEEKRQEVEKAMQVALSTVDTSKVN